MKSPRLIRSFGLFALIATSAWAIATQASADPTRPPASWSQVREAPIKPQPAAPTRHINLIIRGHERAIALVDGQPVRVGDRLGPARVVRIEPQGLVLSNGSVLEIPSPPPLHPTGNRP